jgi:eukaryotic-like serine/threonine-protein kinase
MTTKTGIEGRNLTTAEAASTVVILPPERLESRTNVTSRSLGIGTRFSIATAVLLLVTLGVLLLVVNAHANRVARESIRDDLSRAPAIFGAYQADLQARTGNQVRSVAGEPGTKAVFDPGVSVSTRHEFALDTAGVLAGTRTVFLFDADARVLARSDRKEGEGVGQDFHGARWVAEPLETWREAAAVIREGKDLSVVAAAPVISGSGDMARLDGVLAASFPLTAAHAKALQGLTRGEVAFLVDSAKRGQPPQPALSTATAGFGGEAVVAVLAALPGAADAVLRRGEPFGPFELVVEKVRRICLVVPIVGSNGEAYGAFVVSRSVAAEMAAFDRIRLTLFLVGAIALLLAVPASFLLGRRLSRPLTQLAAGAAAIRDGDLDVALPESGGGEVGALACAFRAMVGELREKRALEELIVAMQPAARPLSSVSEETGPAPLQKGVLKLGTLLASRYRIESILGSGAMGTVFLADDLQLEESVALKVLVSESFIPGTNALQNVKSEIRVARRITHPNVVRVHDLGEAEGLWFLTMEYVPGMTLRQVIRQHGALALRPGLQIAKQLCRGLAAVHTAGIVHRDVKPQNIMVLPSGLVKLMDFGIAQTEGGHDLAAESGFLVGTPSYMSPEQTQGAVVDSRSDIYAVGAVMFEMFTGTTPFTSDDPMKVMQMHVSAEPPPPSRLRPDLPENLERLILACLAKLPVRRPASAQDLHGALLRIHLPEE